jgi:hypothetical protein
VLVTGEEIYAHRPELAELRFWKCRPCGAWVGCHPGTTKALGTLAKEGLRQLRGEAHEVFDSLWKSRLVSRTDAYAWLAWRLEIDPEECHIAMFDEDLCQKTIKMMGSPRKALAEISELRR